MSWLPCMPVSWSTQSTGVRPRPWSVVIINVSIAVAIMCLNRAPELRQLTVDEVQVIENEVVAARVCPVVRLAKTQPEDAWLALVEIGEGDAEGERVIAAFSPGFDDLLAQRGQLIHLRRAERGRYRFEGPFMKNVPSLREAAILKRPEPICATSVGFRPSLRCA